MEREEDSGVRAKPPLLVIPHQGIGDHVICNGLYRTLSDTRKVFLMLYPDYAKDVQTMLADTDIEVILTSSPENRCDMIISDRFADMPTLRLGWYGPRGSFNGNPADSGFYSQAGIPFENRWRRFALPDGIPQIKPPKRKYAFVHSGHGVFPVSELRGVRRRKKHRHDFFSHIDLIKHADEIRCVNSSFVLLADSFDLSGKKLVLHHCNRGEIGLRNKWQIVP